MTIQDRTQTIEHQIGAQGTLEIRLPDAEVRLRGVDGGIVRGRVSGDDVEELVRVDATDGRLTISSEAELRGFGLGIGLAILGMRSHDTYEVELEVPRNARVNVAIASGEIGGEGMTGRQRYRSASGDIELSGSAGAVEMEAVSGGIRLSGPGPVKIRARTVSGDSDLETGLIQALNLASTSGDVQLSGEFEADGEHRISTVSGDVELDIDGGLRVEASTVSGDIDSDVPHRTEGGRGRRSLIVGDGGATLFFKSVSGDLRIRSRGNGRRRAEREPNVEIGIVAAPSPRELEGPPANMDRIAILEGVERGEISVDEASRWLALLADDE